ncbi:hypothetical protein SAMN05421841_4181 [Chryseobacterium wanjuense]|jgi:hypothetical protein|uniref:Uncharacterized protein n=1 Tax=Chryseobacterium wanjuense TaxID=356305 RepID=A0A1I0S4C3_9FLAO|nr:hypothetical protein [Chryseobacterium wanjuense]SEW49466.1 hypothetical protein SAMN05421841_4181 [Chryseobacterium wanjuense]
MVQIKLAFRIVIDQESTMLWDKYIFEDTYFEYRVQHQVFDNEKEPVDNYWELLVKNPNAAKIPFLLSAVVSNYVAQLNGSIKSLPDVLGTTFFPIETFRLDLISSNVTDASKHKLGITFYTPILQLIDIIDNKYLLSKSEDTDHLETFMFAFHPQIAIAYYQNS